MERAKAQKASAKQKDVLTVLNETEAFLGGDESYLIVDGNFINKRQVVDSDSGETYYAWILGPACQEKKEKRTYKSRYQDEQE